MDTPPEPYICNDFDYPSYDTVCDLLSKVKQINVSSEYSKVNHQYLKLIWENIDNSSNSELELIFSIIAFEIWLKKFKVLL